MIRLAIAILVMWALAAVFGGWLVEGPNAVRLEAILSQPWQPLILGADDLGRSLAERVTAGAQTSFVAAVAVVLVSASVGTLIGALAGWYRGWLDALLARIIDIFLAFPGILLAIALAAVLGPGIGNVVIALSLVGWVGFARLARAQVLSLRSRDHILSARALGQPEPIILLRHVLPLIAAPIWIEASFGIAQVVVAEAGLSFLGLGVQPPEASWGAMIRDGTRYLLVAPHLALVPGLALVAVVLAVNLAGDALRDRLDVRTSKPERSRVKQGS